MTFQPVLRLLFALFFIVTLPSYAANVVTLATTSWEPYVRDNAAYKGYTYEIVKQSFEAAGYEVKVIFMPWRVALAALKVGKVDAVFPEYYSRDRALDMVFSQAFSGGPIAFYKKRGQKITFPLAKPTIMAQPKTDLAKALTRMTDYRFGVVIGYANVPAFDNDHQLTKVAVTSDKANLEQLAQGKVELAIIDKYVADYLLNNQLPASYRQQLIYMPPILGYKRLYLGVSKQNPDYQVILSAFNQGLVTIKKNGTMAKILDRDAAETGSQVA